MTLVITAAGVALVLATLFTPRAIAPGLPSAGGVPSLALPVVTAVSIVAAAATVGWLIGAAVLASPQPSGTVDVGGYRCLRAASLAAVGWAAIEVVLIPLLAARRLRKPLGEVLDAGTLTRMAGDAPRVTAALIVLVVAIVIAVAARSVMRVDGARLLVGLALAGVVVMGVGMTTGPVANQDFAIPGGLYHLLGVTVWLGGVIALIGLIRQRAPHPARVIRRYSALATTAILTVAASGVVLSLVRLPHARDLVTTGYGRLTIAQAALIIVLGAIAIVHRRRLLSHLGDAAPSRSLIRLAVVEAGVLAVAVGVGAALAHTATPPLPGVVPSPAASVIGFEFPGAPSVMNFLLWWRLDLVLGVGAIVGMASYVLGVRRLRRRGETWPGLRILAWMIGCVVLLWATSSGMGLYARAQLSANVVEHMILVMIVPVFLVLGGPVTLAHRVFDRGATDRATTGSRLAYWLTHPLLIVVVFVASFIVWYFTPAFGLVTASYPGKLAGEVYFLALGYWYYSAVIGIDPWPRQHSTLVKFVMVVVPLPFYAFIGLAMLSSQDLIAADYFHSVALPWVGNLLDDQHLGAGLGWGLTEGPLAIVMIVLAAQWAASDERRAKQRDREADDHDDPELAAYNEMLTAMAERDGR